MRHSERVFKNGLLSANRELLIKALINKLMDCNMNPRSLKDDHIIDIYTETLEIK